MVESPKVNIRQYKEADRSVVVELIEENDLARGHAVGHLQGIIDRRNILVADKLGEVIGTVVFDNPNNNLSADINYVAVHDNFRRLGIGRMLVAQAEKMMRGLGARKINLLAQGFKPELINFYTNLGFVLADSDGLMKKRLK